MAMDKKNTAVIRQSFANTALGHKIQEVASDRKAHAATYFRYAEIFIVAIVLVLLVLQTQNLTNPIFGYVGAGLTAVEILLLIIKQSFHFDEDVIAHKNAATAYLGLRDRYRLLITDIVNTSLTSKEIMRRRDGLLHEYQLITSLSLPTTSKDYTEALRRMKIETDEENVWSDNQIDHLLPQDLRRDA